MMILNDLSGSILKKAELNNDFTTTYSDVMKKIFELQMTDGEEVLEVLGIMGA